MHLALDLQLGRELHDARERGAHLARRRQFERAEVRGREQRHSWHDAEAPHLVRREQRHLGDVLGVGLGGDVGVADEYGARRHHERVHRRVVAHARAQSDHLVDVTHVLGEHAERAADGGVRLALVHHHRRDQRLVAAHLDTRVLGRHAFALGELLIAPPVVAVARIELRIHQLDLLAGPHAQAEPLEALRHHLRPADDDRLREALVDHDLHRAQHALVLALGVGDAARRRLCRGEQRLHDEA